MKRFALIILCLALAGCGKKSEEEAPATDHKKPTIYTTFYPLQYFAERIAGEHAHVVCPLPPDADPIFWQPDDQAIAGFQAADLIFTNGAGFEKWLDKVNLPASRVVDTCEGSEDAFIYYEQAKTHRHGPSGEHAHEGLDGHTWLDPVLALNQAMAIHEALSKVSAENLPPQVAENHRLLSLDLQQLAHDLEELKPGPLLASHPAYNYLARRYAWNMTNLNLDPEILPDAETIAHIKAHPAAIILWESEPLPDIAKALAPKQSMVFSPCEHAPANGDYLSVMKENIDRLQHALSRP